MLLREKKTLVGTLNTVTHAWEWVVLVNRGTPNYIVHKHQTSLKAQT